MSTDISFGADDVVSEGRRVVEEELLALRYAAERLDERFALAVNLMASAGKVVVSGVGKSGLIARKIVATLVSTGTPAVFLHPVEALHGDIGIVERGDCVVLLSKSGNTAELLKLLPPLRVRNVSVVSLLGATDSPLASLSDVVIDASVAREACPLNAAPMSSTTVALVLGDALAAALIRVRSFTIGQFAARHPLGQLGRNISLRVHEAMHAGEHLPVVAPDASFREALIESTRKGLGCVCVVDSVGGLQGIITDGDVRRALQQYEDIAHLKALDVCTVQPVTVAPNALLGEALSLMEKRERQISVLPVVDNRTCVGVIRVHDIVRVGL